MSMLEQDAFQCRGAIIVKVGPALADATERRGIKVRRGEFVFEADVERRARRIRWRDVATCAATRLKRLAAAVNGRSVRVTAQRVERRRRRRESSQVRGECGDLLFARLPALHRRLD